MEQNSDQWSVIIMDFPDPHAEALAKLYSEYFYTMVSKRLAPGGRAVTQSTSPYFARDAFWCVVETTKSVGFSVNPYHVWVPSFGEWGFVMMGDVPVEPRGASILVQTEWLDDLTFRGLFHFPEDMKAVEVEPNTLLDPVIIGYYNDAWSKWF